MDLLDEHAFACPHCGADISMVLDLSVDDEVQEYVEDCETCCRPIEVRLRARDGALLEFEAST